jgi:peroxiredoxin
MNRLFKLVALAGVTLLPAMAVDVPRQAPEFSAKLPNGGQILLSKYRGKVVALEFLFTTCPHCQHASQVMSQLQTEYGPKGFQALGVAFNDMSQMLVSDFVRDFKVNYPVGFSTRPPVNAFLQNDPNNALHVPQIVIIDRKGVIRHQSLPRNDANTATETFMRKTIESLLKEPAAAPAKRATAKKPPKKTS